MVIRRREARVSLSAATHARLKEFCSANGVSMAVVIEDSVDKFIDEHPENLLEPHGPVAEALATEMYRKSRAVKGDAPVARPYVDPGPAASEMYLRSREEKKR